jgi:hypothetical protein
VRPRSNARDRRTQATLPLAALLGALSNAGVPRVVDAIRAQR